MMHYQQTCECLASKPHKQKLFKTLYTEKNNRNDGGGGAEADLASCILMSY